MDPRNIHRALIKSAQVTSRMRGEISFVANAIVKTLGIRECTEQAKNWERDWREFKAAAMRSPYGGVVWTMRLRDDLMAILCKDAEQVGNDETRALYRACIHFDANTERDVEIVAPVNVWRVHQHLPTLIDLARWEFPVLEERWKPMLSPAEM